MPLIRWQFRQPLSRKALAPSNTGPLVAPTTFSGSGCASKFGDHGELWPAIQSEPIMITLSRTTAIDHGRREGARSPLLLSIGAASNRMPMITDLESSRSL